MIAFLYLGKSILAVVSERSMDWITKSDILGTVKKLYDEADTGTPL